MEIPPMCVPRTNQMRQWRAKQKYRQLKELQEEDPDAVTEHEVRNALMEWKAELTRVVSFEDLDGGDSGTGSAGSKRKADAPLAVPSSADDDETAS